MSSFTDQLALDQNIFLDTEGFGQAALYAPTDSGGSTFAVVVVVGDPVMSEGQQDFGIEVRRVATLYVQKSVVLAGIFGITGTSRDTRRGDSITIASGADAGTWLLQGPPAEDLGDGANLIGVLPAIAAPGAKGARELR